MTDLQTAHICFNKYHNLLQLITCNCASVIWTNARTHVKHPVHMVYNVRVKLSFYQALARKLPN